MKKQRYAIQFPASDLRVLGQDEAFFYLADNGSNKKLRFHDYDEIYMREGLYEQLFYDRLQCASPAKAAEILRAVLGNNGLEISRLRALDLGAGNGMVGELLPAARTVGVDICLEAKRACERDRPGAYDAYYVMDFCNLGGEERREMEDWNFNCLTCIAALGFGDIPTKAFATAYQLIRTGGWVVFNIKEAFLRESDISGFSKLVKFLLLSDVFEIHHMERYRHRSSIEGIPLHYNMVVGRKMSDIPEPILAEVDQE